MPRGYSSFLFRDFQKINYPLDISEKQCRDAKFSRCAAGGRPSVGDWRRVETRVVDNAQLISGDVYTDAYYGYVRWGALAKVDDLAKRYPQLLSPILQQEKLSFHKSDKSTYSHSTTRSNRFDRQTVCL